MSQDNYGASTGQGFGSGASGYGSDNNGNTSTGQGGGSSEAFESVKNSASSLTDKVRDRAADYAGEGKQRLIEQLDHLAEAIRHASNNLQNSEQATPARFARQAADRVEDLSRTLNDRSLDELLRDLQSFSRRNSTAIFGGALLAGLALGRLAIASSQNRAERQFRDGSDLDDSYRMGEGGYSPGQDGYSYGQGGYSPSQGAYSPGQGGYSSGQGGDNPGQGGMSGGGGRPSSARSAGVGRI